MRRRHRHARRARPYATDFGGTISSNDSIGMQIAIRGIGFSINKKSFRLIRRVRCANGSFSLLTYPRLKIFGANLGGTNRLSTPRCRSFGNWMTIGASKEGSISPSLNEETPVRV